MTSKTGAVLAALTALACWGLSPLLYRALQHVPPGEIIAHRGLWAGVFLAGISFRSAEASAPLRRPKLLLWIGLAAALVSVNWLAFVWAVQQGRAAEASFGYYIYPIIAVLAGAILLGEGLSRLQMAALALAGAAVAALWAGGGFSPSLPLFLAVTFVAYGFLRKLAPVGAAAGTLWEMILIAPFALAWLIHIHGGAFVHEGWRERILLILAGILTGAPLALFAQAARRLDYSTIGILFYLNPTLQFFCATMIFGEPVTAGRLLAFGVIWAAVGLYCLDLWRKGGRAPS